jgi:hypothetical protein
MVYANASRLNWNNIWLLQWDIYLGSPVSGSERRWSEMDFWGDVMQMSSSNTVPWPFVKYILKLCFGMQGQIDILHVTEYAFPNGNTQMHASRTALAHAWLCHPPCSAHYDSLVPIGNVCRLVIHIFCLVLIITQCTWFTPMSQPGSKLNVAAFSRCKTRLHGRLGETNRNLSLVTLRVGYFQLDEKRRG